MCTAGECFQAVPAVRVLALQGHAWVEAGKTRQHNDSFPLRSEDSIGNIGQKTYRIQDIQETIGYRTILDRTEDTRLTNLFNILVC